jgi:hypothetical protein
VDAEFEGAAGGECKNERRGAFGAQNQKPSCPGSVSVWGVQIAKGLVKEVHGEERIWWLMWWGACNRTGSGRNTWIDKIGHLMKKNEKAHQTHLEP